MMSVKSVAQTITASPGWSIAIPASSITEAGSNYTTNATSTANQTLISVTSSFLASYTVTVHRDNTNWNSALTLWVQRTGNGSGSFFGTIAGGLSFQQVGTAAQTFFSGIIGFPTNRSNIPIQYQISGLSVLIPVKTYTTTITYTVSN